MSTSSGREGKVPRAEADEKNTSKGSGESSKQRSSPVYLKNVQSLERLRERVKKAARELERLRKENSALAERIRQLETRPAVDLDSTLLMFDEDPEVLREKVEGFIRSIDAYLANEPSGS